MKLGPLLMLAAGFRNEEPAGRNSFVKTDQLLATLANARYGKVKGDVRPFQQFREFSREWYGRHLATDWRKWSAEEASAMSARHGLDGPIWDIPSVQKRF
jgi:hypothetical protein